MALYISKNELLRRVNSGVVDVNGEKHEIYKDYGIDENDPRYFKFFDALKRVVDSMDPLGVNIYPMEYRGNKIRDARIRRGVKISTLAKMTGISTTAILRLERGDTNPRPETVSKIAQALEADVEEFT